MNPRKHLDFLIADMPVRVKSDDPLNLDCLAGRRLRYLSPAKKPYFQIQMDSAEKNFQFSHADKAEIISKGDIFVFRKNSRTGRDFGVIDRKSRSCRFYIRPPLFDVLFSPFLLAAGSLFLSGWGGVILHAATAVYKGSAYIFSGPSGSGKTTVAEFLKKNGIRVVSDEEIIIRKKRGKFMAFASYGTRGKIKPIAIKGIFFLKKSRRVFFAPLKAADAVCALYPNVRLKIMDARIASCVLETLRLFLREVPAYEMEFLKDDSFWPRLKKLV